jgi:hypothetical protein
VTCADAESCLYNIWILYCATAFRHDQGYAPRYGTGNTPAITPRGVATMNPQLAAELANRAQLKTREQQLRRKAARQGLRLLKSHLRDPDSLGYGTYMLVDAATNWVAFMDYGMPAGYGLDLDDVQDYLTGQINADEQP